MNFKLLLVLFLSLLVFLSGCIVPFSSTDENLFLKIYLKTDKTEYVAEETIKIFLTNDFDKSVFIKPGCLHEFKIINTESDSELLINNHDIVCKLPPYIEIKSGEQYEMKWNGTEIKVLETNPPKYTEVQTIGTFKAKINYFESKELTGKPQPIESNEFEIKEKTVKLSYSPIQCGTNPWEKWYQGAKPLLEEDTLKLYYSQAHGIEILAYNNVSAPPNLIVCKACSCQRGDTIEIEVSETNKAKMIELGWKENSLANEIIDSSKPEGVSAAPSSTCQIIAKVLSLQEETSTSPFTGKVYNYFMAKSDILEIFTIKQEGVRFCDDEYVANAEESGQIVSLAVAKEDLNLSDNATTEQLNNLVQNGLKINAKIQFGGDESFHGYFLSDLNILKEQ